MMDIVSSYARWEINLDEMNSSASRITDEIVALISLMLLEYSANNSYKDLSAQACRQK